MQKLKKTQDCPAAPLTATYESYGRGRGLIHVLFWLGNNVLCDYPCGKEVSDSVHNGEVPDSADGSSQNTAGSSLICCEALGIPAWNYHSEEERWHPTV